MVMFQYFFLLTDHSMQCLKHKLQTQGEVQNCDICY
jgi:hypothetical protein